MYSIIDTIRADAAKQLRTIILPEALDERILRAAIEVKNAGIASPVLLGVPQEIRRAAQQYNLDIGTITLLDSDVLSRSEKYLSHLYSCKQYCAYSQKELIDTLRNPLALACCLLATGEVDGGVAGAINTTRQVISQSLRIVGVRAQNSLLSSFMVLQFKVPPAAGLDFVIYADCAINIRPDSHQLTQIARSTVQSARQIFKLDPKVAMLSFSTSGSADHPEVSKVKRAAQALKAEDSNLDVIGEVQFDTALLPSVRNLKMSDPAYNMPTNIYIFPNLDAGNIAYKITEQIGGAKVVGPILQGLKKPMNDLSRGASVETIINTIAMTCLQVR